MRARSFANEIDNWTYTVADDLIGARIYVLRFLQWRYVFQDKKIGVKSLQPCYLVRLQLTVGAYVFLKELRKSIFQWIGLHQSKKSFFFVSRVSEQLFTWNRQLHPIAICSVSFPIECERNNFVVQCSLEKKLAINVCLCVVRNI